MTLLDRDIIKAFECCTKIEEGESLKLCFECPMFEEDVDNCTASLFRAVLDLINRQQTEIERYKTLYEDLKAENLETIKAIKDYKTEAIKDFVHYFFDECLEYPLEPGDLTILVSRQDFDNLVKYMTEGKNE